MSFLRDALGSTIALTDSAGALSTQYTYQPFGATTVSGPANTNPYQFTGRESDGTGLYFYRARYYSPTLKRFTAQDPVEFQGGGTNLYGYVGGNPISFRDESGEGPIAAALVAAACFGYAAYSHYSHFAELDELGREQERIGQQINGLRQQQNSCSSPEEQGELQEQIDQLQLQYEKLVGLYAQYAQTHFLDSFSDDAKIAACVLAVRLALRSPLP